MVRKGKGKGKGQGLGGAVYDGAAGFGRFMAGLGLVFAVIIGLILVFVGVSQLFAVQKNLTFVQGKVEEITPDCRQNDEMCKFTAAFGDADGKKHIHPFTVPAQDMPFQDQEIGIYYDPSDMSDVRLGPDKSHRNGTILVSIGFVIMFFGWLNFYIVRRFKFAAAVSGIDSGMDLLFN
tara:strand:- start:842 stop:1375 length:534 start_codon:yes stop_codon:yes gene_type:complete